jgi:uncharacterized protein
VSAEPENRMSPPERLEPSIRVQAIEVTVFLFLVVPSLAFSFVSTTSYSGFVLTASATILRDLALVGLILFFLWRNREPLARIFWTARRFGREIALGLALFVPVFFGASLLDGLLRSAGLSSPPSSLPKGLYPAGAGQTALAILLLCVVAVSEETIFRGYLLQRFRSTTHSQGLAVLISTLVFAIGHGYEGTVGVLTVAALGVVYSSVALWRKSLVAPMVMHLLQDLLVIVILPALGWK